MSSCRFKRLRCGQRLAFRRHLVRLCQTDVVDPVGIPQQQAAGSQQLKTTLLKGEDALATLVLTGQQAQWYLESDLLPGKTYSLTRDLKEAFMHLSAPQEESQMALPSSSLE